MELSGFTLSHEAPMTGDRMALIEARRVAEEGRFLRSLAETGLPILMEADVEGLIGAGRYERSGERTTGAATGAASARSTRGWDR